MTEKEFPHYWICNTCATERGGAWPKEHMVTMSLIPCKYCNDKNRNANEPTAPWVDYDWPDKEVTKKARVLRD